MNLNKESDAMIAPGPITSTSDSVQNDWELLSNENKCLSWLEQCSIGGDQSSIFSSETSGTKDEESESEGLASTASSESRICERGEDVFDLKASNKQYYNGKLTNCENVVLGNITKIYGPVYITQSTSVTNQQSVTNQLFLKESAVPASNSKVFTIDRRSWLASPPLEEWECLDKPAKYVIIVHTATEEGFTQSENIDLVHSIQQFHVKSRNFSDICYNFLIGSDGQTYEGRGWHVAGAHTFGYNNISVGIAFVGYFTKKLPPTKALNQAKALIKHGVEIGAIDKNYYLVGHCQCRPFESPGKMLYEEIKTWDNWHRMDIEST